MQDIALAILVITGLIGGVAHRSLTNCLKRGRNVGWTIVDIPDVSQRDAMRNEVTFLWNIVTRKYRHDESRKIRLLGDLNLFCFLTMWIIALAVVMFGDLGRYDRFFAS